MKEFVEYHDLYMKTDVLILADIIEQFRNISLIDYKLDPAYYYTSPNFFWDALLLMTGAKLELLTEDDKDIYLLFEMGIRGGMSQTGSLRYAKIDENTHLEYFDANSLYATAMLHKLPVSGFRFVDDFNIETYLTMSEDELMNLDESYLIECDLDYPLELHDKHIDLPLAPEKMIVKKEHLPNNYKEDKFEKLVTNLFPKKKYILYLENLVLYIKLGLELKSVYRVVKFNQFAWMKPYIEFNLKKRAETSEKFLQDYYKLGNNAVFGKTMENTRKYMNMSFETDPEKIKNIVAHPTYIDFQIITPDIIAIHRGKHKIKLNKPIYVGCKILDLSKYHMYDFFYNVLKVKYGDNIKLNLTDTDSFVVTIKTKDFNKDVLGDKWFNNYLDFNKFPIDHPLFNNNIACGKFKSEREGKILKEIAAVKSKCYSYEKESRAKGIVQAVRKNVLKHEDFVKAIFGTDLTVTQQTFRSYGHQLYTVEDTKIALTGDDTKRYICRNPINTRPIGHKANYIDNIIDELVDRLPITD